MIILLRMMVLRMHTTRRSEVILKFTVWQVQVQLCLYVQHIHRAGPELLYIYVQQLCILPQIDFSPIHVMINRIANKHL